MVRGRVLGMCTLGLQQGADGEGACPGHVQYILILVQCTVHISYLFISRVVHVPP